MHKEECLTALLDNELPEYVEADGLLEDKSQGCTALRQWIIETLVKNGLTWVNGLKHIAELNGRMSNTLLEQRSHL